MAAKKVGVSKDQQLVVWSELNQLRVLNILPEAFEKATIDTGRGTPVHDVNGDVLFYRIPLERRGAAGYVDLAAHPILGEPLVATSTGAAWDADALVEAGRRAAVASGVKGIDKAAVRFVAYSFPKIALQFLDGREEIAMLELYSWEHVPPSTRTTHYEPPSNFERWSFIDEMPDDERAERVDRFTARVKRWRDALRQAPRDLASVDSRLFTERFRLVDRFLLNRTRELHYSTRNADHVPCYELRGQQTNVWCVGASVQMLLDFYRYEYTQVRLASELGLGTLANPNGLPYSRDNDVVTVIERMSRNALDATMNTSPTFAQFESEIDQNRPLVSFVPGHSRTVAGYTRSFISIIGQSPFRGLLVYDPWPPNAGVITRWENFNTTTYRRTFSAVLRRA